MWSEAGSRFDQNIAGFRAEEEFGSNAEPYVRTGKFVKIPGLGRGASGSFPDGRPYASVRDLLRQRT